MPKRLTIFFLLTLPLFSAAAVDFGVRLNAGLSSGIGKEWNRMLDQAGSRDFNDVLFFQGASVLADIPLKSNIHIVPELGYVGNRGTRIAAGNGDYFENLNRNAFIFVLPTAYEIPWGSGDRALRLSAGVQLDYLLDLSHISVVGEADEEKESEEYIPIAVGVIGGAGLEFRRQKPLSWFTDLRLKLPLSDSLTYREANGEMRSLKTAEISLGLGVRFP